MPLENYADYTLESHDGILPTLDGKAEGIVGWDPMKVQCCDCHRTMTGPIKILVLQWAVNNRRSGLPGRRCADCWLALGWEGSSADGWRQK